MLPSVRPTTSAPETFKLSRVNGWPMRSPTDASTEPSRMPPHGSGPMWFATPSSRRTFTPYSLPVSTGAPVCLISAPPATSARGGGKANVTPLDRSEKPFIQTDLLYSDLSYVNTKAEVFH